MTDITILGAGPAGLGVAFYAYRAGLPFVVFEGASEPGGMCRTLRCGAHRYDRGAHRFHDRNPEITRDLVGLLGDDLVRVDAPSAIWDVGRWIEFPPTPLNVIFAYGFRDARKICFDLLRSGLRPRGPVASFEDFAVRRFGKTLARRILLNYSAKLWGLPTDELSPDIATRRLQGMTLRSLIYELLFPGGKTEHVDGSFFYPRQGYGQIVEALVAALPPGSIRTGRAVAGLDCDRGLVRRVRFADGEVFEVPDRVVSTLPLPFLAGLLREVLPESAREAASRLRFRHIRLLFVRLAVERVSPNASIYIPDPAFSVSRIYEPKNRSAAMAPPEETAIVAEVPCFTGDPIERLSPAAFAEKIVGELTTLRLIRRGDVVETREHFVPNAYPVYANGYGRDVALVCDGLERIANLEPLGRSGRFVYSHLHDQLRFGRDYVRRQAESWGATSA